MVSKVNRSEVRVNKHRRLRSRLSGTPEKTTFGSIPQQQSYVCTGN